MNDAVKVVKLKFGLWVATMRKCASTRCDVVKGQDHQGMQNDRSDGHASCC